MNPKNTISLDEYNVQDLMLKNYEFEYFSQTDVFDSKEIPHSRVGYKNSDITQQIGKFFERISQAIYGGEMQKGHNIGNCEEYCQPDLTCSKGKLIIEVKGRQMASSVDLQNRQIARYALLKLKSPLDVQIRFDIYRYNLKNVKQEFRKGGLEWMLETFPKHITSFISLPFPLVYDLWNPLNKKMNVSENVSATYLPGSFLDELIRDPINALDDIDEDISKYIFIKNKFPSNAKIGSTNFLPFPCLKILSKFPKYFSKEFKKKNKDRTISYFERGLKTPEELGEKTQKEIQDLFEEGIPLI